MAKRLDANDVFELMKKYFSNKEQRRVIKKERNDYMQTFKCEGEDCIRDGTKPEDFCEPCVKRHSFFLRLRKIKNENTGIIIRVKRACVRVD